MSYFLWFLIVLIIILGFIGGYYQLMLFGDLKKGKFSDIFLGAWLFSADNLTEKGKFYRRRIFICWGWAVMLIILVQSLS